MFIRVFTVYTFVWEWEELEGLQKGLMFTCAKRFFEETNFSQDKQLIVKKEI